MTELIKLIMDKNLGDVFSNLTNNISAEKIKKNHTKILKVESIYNYLMRFVFIVSDLNDFTDKVKKSIDGKINLGPQKKKKQIP